TAVQESLKLPQLRLQGVHSHIGSQIFEVEGFRAAADKVSRFAAEIRDKFNCTFTVINLGGGFGIRYMEGDTPLPAGQYVKAIVDAVQTNLAAYNYPMPEIWIEPGRSIVGDAGTTLYT